MSQHRQRVSVVMNWRRSRIQRGTRLRKKKGTAAHYFFSIIKKRFTNFQLIIPHYRIKIGWKNIFFFYSLYINRFFSVTDNLSCIDKVDLVEAFFLFNLISLWLKLYSIVLYYDFLDWHIPHKSKDPWKYKVANKSVWRCGNC